MTNPQKYALHAWQHSMLVWLLGRSICTSPSTKEHNGLLIDAIVQNYFQFLSWILQQESKRAWVIPSKVEPLYTCWWENGKVTRDFPTLQQIRDNVQVSLKTLRQDHKRSLNPTPYKVHILDTQSFVGFNSEFSSSRRHLDIPLPVRSLPHPRKARLFYFETNLVSFIKATKLFVEWTNGPVNVHLLPPSYIEKGTIT